MLAWNPIAAVIGELRCPRQRQRARPEAGYAGKRMLNRSHHGDVAAMGNAARMPEAANAGFGTTSAG
jgi:hypothetical protein